MDSEQESEGRRDSDATLDGSDIGSSKSSEYSGSISSSSSGTSSDDYIQVDPKLVFKSISSDVASNSKSHPDAKLLSQSDYTDSNVMCHKLEESSKASTSSTSQVSDVTHESAFPTMSPTQSPSIQVMEKQAGFDPNRIPSSVFGSKDSSSKEWSTASNESLFSIHTAGNASPARDDIVMVDGNFKQSRKRDNCRESNKSEEVNKSDNRFRQTMPAAKGGVRKDKTFKKERNVNPANNLLATGSSDEPTQRVVRFREDIKVGELRDHSTAIGLSDGNGGFRGSCSADGTSCTFPVKKKSSWWSMCCHCSWGSCCSSWPSCRVKCSGCSCKWLSCAGCSLKWLSCAGCSLKWLSCSGCSCKWLSCSGCSCKWLSCSGCSFKWLSCSGCSFKWLSCSGCSCKWLSCAGCHCKWPSMPVGCCKWPSCHLKCLTSLRCCC